MTSIATTLTPQHVQAWKTAISTGGAVAMSPAIAVTVALLVASLLPAIALVLPLVATSFARTIRLPAGPVWPALPLQAALAR